jgi:hypothetical protein
LTAAQKLTESGLARELGVSRQAVHDLVKRGILTKDASNLIDLDTAKKELMNKVRPSGKTAANLQPEPASTLAESPTATDPQQPPAPSEPTDYNDPEITSYHVAKTLREAAEAQIARHKLGLLQGSIIPRDHAERAMMLVGRQVRDALQSSRRRLSPYLASASNVAECEELLRKDHQQLLDNLVTGLAAIVPTTEALQA